MATKDLAHLLGPCYQVLWERSRLEINRKREREWFENGLVGRGLKGSAWEEAGDIAVPKEKAC